MRSRAGAADAYAWQGHDALRSAFELPWLERALARLLRAAPGGELLDLGCGDAAVAGMGGGALSRYVGLDLEPPRLSAEVVRHDLREGLGPVGARPFDVYLGSFGVASHLAPGELTRLLVEIRRHARPGALVALEALGLFSLEWPGLWASQPGVARMLSYRMARDVSVHPWAPAELFGLFAQAGIRPLRAADRTLQAGPKAGVYWPGLPPLRRALAELYAGGEAAAGVLARPLPPLPAGPAALLHHTLAVRRARLLASGSRSASALWDLEPRTAGGFGHGLLVVGRVPG